MKKPIIKNWMKYWTTTIAAAGMLALGACDSNEKSTGDRVADNIETTTEETLTDTRENVSQTADEAEAETEQLGNTESEQETTKNIPSQTQNERSTNNSADRSASSIKNMDSHLEKHQDENKAIKEELTETNLTEQRNNASQQESTDYTQSSTEQGQEQVTQPNTDQGQGSVEMEAPDNTQEIQTESPEASESKAKMEAAGDEANTEISRETDPGTAASIYERHISIYAQELSGYSKQRFDDIMGDYYQRNANTTGQMDEQAGVFVVPDVAPKPTIGFEDLRFQIYDNMEYPPNAEAANVEGIVLVNLMVDKDGKVVEVKAMDDIIIPSEENNHAPQYPQSFSEEDIADAKEDLKKEAERAVQATDGLWEAGTKNGEKIKSSILIPINFEVRSIGVGEDEVLGGEGQEVDIMD